jgi:TrmH family RNA methyltransferase
LDGNVASALGHITIVLVRPQQAGNIGVAARAIANHGIGRLALVAPPRFDPERARWMAPKSHHVINNALYCSTISDAVADAQTVIATTARPRTRDWPVHPPEIVGTNIAKSRQPTAILFGPEDSGLSNDDLSLAESLLHFPTTEVSSMNLGQAVTATAAALAAAHRILADGVPDAEHVPAAVGRREELIKRVVSVLEESDYLNGRSHEIVTNTLIRIAGRSSLCDEEVNNLLGMVKQVAWRIKSQSP